tara:strand:- start:27 stop:2027 length:2001 start_codon:yes stop_codon:yes gene_type:complete
MATPEELKKQIQELREEFILLEGGFKGVGEALSKELTDNLERVSDAAKGVVKSLGDDLVKGVGSSNNQLKTQQGLLEKASKGQNVAKEVEKEIAKVQKEKATFERKLNAAKAAGATFNEETLYNQREYYESQLGSLFAINKINTEQIAQKGLTGNILENAKEYLITIDKSGLASKILNGELSATQKLSLVTEGAFIAIAKAALEGSNNIASLQQNLGISYQSAYELQNSLAITAANADSILITSQKLNKAFSDIANETGIIANFGGDTLATFSKLTNELGLGVSEASQLTFLARTQSENTEGVLTNTVATVNALNKQNGVAISAKAVLNDIAGTSKSIVVSLGMSPEILSEAATEARALGLSLDQVDKIAGSLLDFESSIRNEIQAELLTGQEINLEKARQAALNNDLVTLEKELKDNAQLAQSFAQSNRIQQEATAAALGLSREEMAGMAYQQELVRLGAEGFAEAYSEQTLQQMLAQSASEKFEKSVEKIKGVIGDIGTLLSPIIDGFASLVAYLSESKILLGALAGLITGLVALQGALAVKSLIGAYAEVFKGSFMTLGGFGLPVALAGAAALGGLIASAQSVEDGIADSSRGPFTITDSFGKMAMTAKGDNLAVSPNISQGGGEENKMIALLERIANKDSNVYMDSQKVGNKLSTSYRTISN